MRVKHDPVIAAYKITDTETGTFYVGSTTNLSRRLGEHRFRLLSGKHPNINLQQGFTCWDNIEIEYTAVPTEELSKKLEQSLLDFHRGDPNCANLGTGAITPWSNGMPDESREKCRLANLGRTRSPETIQRIREAAQQRPPVSEETRRKLSMIGKGRPHSDEHKQQIAASRRKQIIIDGVKYDGIEVAAKSLGLSRPTVRKRLQSPDCTTWNFT